MKKPPVIPEEPRDEAAFVELCAGEYIAPAKFEDDSQIFLLVQGTAALKEHEMQLLLLDTCRLTADRVRQLERIRILSEFANHKKKIIRWFVHDISGPLLLLRDNSLPAILRVADGSPQKAEIASTVRRAEQVVDFAVSSFHSYALLSGLEAKWIPESTLLVDLVDSVLAMLRPNYGDVTFEVDIEPDTGIVCHVDRSKLFSILYNLVDNAAKSMARTEPPKTVRIKARATDETLAIEVEDKGCGISNSDQSGIFKEGFSRFGGSGIGLTMIS